MTDSPKRGGAPYGHLAPSDKPGGGGGSSKVIILSVVGAVVLIIAVVALVLTSGENDKVESKQESAAVVIEGDRLPQYPEAGGLAADPASDTAVGMTAPKLTGQNFMGEEVVIDPTDGTPRVVIFAAHWCPHCQKEIPLVADWIAEGKLPDGVEVNLISTAVRNGQSQYPPSNWLASVGWDSPVLLDNGENSAGQAYGLGGYPYMLFIDSTGKVVQRTSGELPIEQFEQYVNQIATPAA